MVEPIQISSGADAATARCTPSARTTERRGGAAYGGRAPDSRQGHADHAIRLGFAQGAGEGRRPRPEQRRNPAARGVRGPLRQRGQLLLRNLGRAGRGRRQGVEARTRRAAHDDDRRAGRVRTGRARQPRFPRGAQGPYGDRRRKPGHGRHLERRQLRGGGGPPATLGSPPLLPPHRSDRERLRPADRGSAAGRRSEHDGGRPR